MLHRVLLQRSLLQAFSTAATTQHPAIAHAGMQVATMASSVHGERSGAGVGSGAWSWAWRGATTLAAFGLGAGVVTAAADAQGTETAKATPDPYQRPTQLTGLPPCFTLYQYEVCPFCCKVKAMLDFHKLPYRVVEVNPLTKGELKWSSYKKVPVLQWDDGSGHVEVDSSAIMSRISAELASNTYGGPNPAASKGTPRGGSGARGSASGVDEAAEVKWRRWVDERFVKVITANIYRSWDETVDTFQYITTQTRWSWGTRETARWFGAVLMWQIGKRMPGKYNIIGDLRDALYADCNEWVAAVGPDRPFLGGAQPGIADLAVYGVLKAVEHTPTFKDAMAHSHIKPWYDRVEAAIGAPARIDADATAPVTAAAAA